MKYNNLLKYFLFVIISIFFASTSLAATVDIMIVYDTTGKAWVDSNGGMSVFSQQAVDKLNQAATNSGVNLTFRLAHTAEVSYTHSNLPTIREGLSNDLDDLQAGAGNLSIVHTWRNTYGADMVAMFVDTGQDYGYVGMGYILSNPSGSPNYAFNVDNVRAVTSGHTLTHELGHNFGCHHSKYQTQDPGPNYSLNSYSAGWYFNGTNGVAYHTIMAYDTDGYGNSYTEAPLFSTPLLSHQGTVAGSATDGDNARTLRETMDVVAAYRTSSTPSTCALTVTKQGPGSGTVTSAPSGISCGSDCSESYTCGTQVTLSRTVDSGSVWLGWGGDCSGAGTASSCTLTMSANKSVIAEFDKTTSCTYTISPSSSSFAASGGTGSVSVTASSSSCSWTATSNATWITVTAGSSGTGSGSVSYSVSQNTSSSSRTGTITIAGNTFTVTQSGAGSTCTYSISPTTYSFTSSSGSGTVSVTASSSSCAWTATSNATWISVTAGSSGTGSGSVSYSVSQNTSSSSRTGTITIAGNTFTVTQSGTQSTSSIGEAVDNTSLTWTTGGNANWAGQSSTYYYGGDAAKSGTITHNQSTWMQTTVTGPGTLTFYWKVSSEADSQYCYDWLSFYVDSTEMNWICGETNWAQKSYQISSGSHTLKWTYIKDQLTSSGSDAGWVDYVTWQASATPPTGSARLITCDLNGDFKDDLIRIDSIGNIQYSTNLTNWTQISGSLGGDVACGDLNGDGMADIAGVASDGKIWYTLNKGSNWLNISGILSRVFIADMNGDLKSDILGLSSSGYIYITYDLANWSNIPGVLLDIQPGNFNTSRAGNEFAGINTSGYVYYTTNLSSWYNVPGALAKLFAGDINSDGRSDLIGLNSANEIYYTTNLATWTNIPGGLVYITTGDFNGDGKNDIIGLNSANNIYYTINLSTWVNVPGQLTSLATGDFNGDGKDDVAGIGTDGSVYYTVNLTNWSNVDPYFFGNFK